MTDTTISIPSVSLERLPVSLFGSVMGIAGLALAWRQARAVLGAPPLIGEAAGAVALAVFVALGFAYATKAIVHPRATQAEFRHPLTNNFFATIAISLLLLSAVLAPHAPDLRLWVWGLGVLATFGLGYVTARRFLSANNDPTHTSPPLLIPGVAALDIAVTGADLPLAWAHEINVAALAVGSVLAVVLFVLIAARLRHHAPLPGPMTPALLVLVAPFEVGFLAYVNSTGRVDLFAGLLFYFGLFLFLVLAPKVFRRSVPFGAPWWGVSFPMAALTVAALKYAAARGDAFTSFTAASLLGLLSVVIAVLFVRTLAIVINGELLRG